MPTFRPSTLPFTRWLEPFAAGLWIAFLVWSLLVAVIWTSGVGEVEVAEWVRHHFTGANIQTVGQASPLAVTLAGLLRWVDPVWFLLAAANVYLATAEREGLAAARRWSLLICTVATLLGASSTWFGWPLGPLHFTDRLGPRLGPIPLGWPLLWCAVILGARDLARRGGAQAAPWQVALGVGALACLTALNLEPLAWKVRVFWLWYPAQVPAPPAPPLLNFLTWFGAATALAFSMRSPRVLARPSATGARSRRVLLVLNAVCLLTHAVRLR